MTILPFAVTILRSCFWYFHYSRTNLSSRLQLCGQSSREMEDFRGIAEESFPSFLTNSLLGNSEVLENVTLSSNFGLPIAVSTLARNRSGTDNRCPDIQASYLTEGRLSVPSVSSPNCQGDNTEPRGRLQLSFQGDDSASRKKSYIENPHLSLALMKPRTEEKQANTTASVQRQRLLDEVSPLEQVPDSALDFHLKSWMNNQEHKIVMPDARKHLEDKAPNSDFSHISLLENEKLLTLTNLEDSSDDDINDEEFYDDHLEAYFEQLAVPGMLYEAGGQESPENVFKLPANGNNILNCEFQLENDSSLISHGAYTSGSSGTTHRESEEGRDCLLGTSAFAGIVDNIKQRDNVLPFYSHTWRTEKEGAPNLKDVVPDQSRECAGKAVLGKELSTVDETLSPRAGGAVLGEKPHTVNETPSPRAGEAVLGKKPHTMDETPSPRAGGAVLGEKPRTVDETPSPRAGEAVLGEKPRTVDETPSPRAGEAVLGERPHTVDETPSPRAGEAVLGERPHTVDETPSPRAGEAVLGEKPRTVDETPSPRAGEAVLGEKSRTVDETPCPRAGEAVLGEKSRTVDETPSPRAGEAVLGEKLCTVDETLSPPYSHSTDDVRGGFDLADSRKQDSESHHQNKHLASDLETVLNVDRCLNTETPSVFIQKGGSASSLKTNGDNGINFPDTLWSPTCERRACEFYESVTKPNDQADLSQNIVYQNEDGKWVTDLAYYTSFTDQQDLQMSPNNETNEDFRSGTEALDLIAKDEEEFNKEHPFIQDEKIDVQNTSAALDASWVATFNYHLLRKSFGTSDFDKDDGSYLRLSLGEFFAQRSEALGCLGGSSSVKRPSFGYFIRSPEEREPVALLKPDVSRSNLEKEVTHLHQGLFSGNLNEQSQAQLSKGSITLQAEELQSTSQVDENDVTLTANESRTEDTFCSNNKLEEHKSILSSGGDSVLRISTIASAIADVSVSTDPAQLVAMMKALTNKRRGKTFQDDDIQEDCSTTSHFLINDVEKSNRFNAFDMEKYLTKTEVSSCEGTWEPFSRAGTSDIWDLCFPKQQTVQDISMANVCAANVRQPRADSAAFFYGENTESETQESLRTLASPDSGLSNVSENRSSVIGGKACSIDELPGVQTIEKAASVSIPTPDSYSSIRNPGVPSLRLLEKREEIQDNREHRRKKECVSETSSSDKRVTFEEDHIVLPKSVDLTISSPESGGSGFEDQGRFRLSTSPLSHSSPSEISGNFSGYALESRSLAHHQKPHSECELSELACSHADMSRLTYVSEQENTYPITAAPESLEDHKSDLTSELSTTIVRASPTPSEEETTKKLRDKVLGQNTEKVTLPCIIQVKSGVGKVAETPSLSSGFEDEEPNFTSSQDISSRSGEHLEARGVDLTSGPSEQDLIGQALLDKPGLSHRSGPAIPSLLVLNQKTVDQNQRLTSTGLSTASSDSSSQITNLCTSVNQPNLAPHISAPTSVAKVQNQPPLCPAPWTGHSLYTAPVAQQYLGPVPSTGNAALPQCHAGVQVCGISGYSPYPLVAPEHVSSGMCLGPNLASGVMGPSSLYNLCSTAVHQNLLSTAKPFPVQPVAANCETKPWDLGMMSGFGNARVPEELRFPHACCVGIASQTLLSVLNPTDRWLQVSIRVLSICVNGEKVDLSTQTCLVFKNKVVIRPHATEDIKILFIPTNSGIFRCTFSVASWPFSADADTVVQAEALGSRVTLTAVAETPVIEVETEKKGVLDFGDLTYEGWKALPLKLINRTHATVPIRLIINANALAWRCFTFSKEPVHASLRATPYSDGIAQLVAPSVVSHVMPASYDGQDPEFLIVWVIFHSPKKLLTSEILGSAEEFLARVDIEVDSPNPIPVLRSVDLRARAGIARIHAPKDLQTMHLLADINSSTKQPLPLKNAGNIEVYLDIKVAEQGSQFSVDPESLFLKPGEEHEVVVSFTPKDPKAYEERILKIFVQPLGPQYEVVLKGEVISSGSKPLPPGPHSSDIPLILSNKQFLTWGGIPLGRTQLQKLALRNSSTTTAQNLRLLIKGQDQDCFQIKNTFGSEERLTSNCEIRICPGEDCIISVLFAPTRLSCMLAKLEIKQLGNRSQPGIKFMIPLSGYGGTSNLILEDVKKLSDSYLVTVNDLIPGKESKVIFSIRNTGSRAAFVKAICFKDSQRKVLLDPKVMRIFPDKFVLKERTQEDITLIYSPSHRKNDSKPATELLTVYFFGGDEISRQLYRRALLHKPGAIKQILPEHSVLQNIDFAEAFQDELLTDEACDLPQRPNDIQLFYGSMRKITLSVIGEFRDSVSSREFLQPSSSAMLESKSESGTSGKQSGNVSLDVLPVKGPQGPPFLSHIAHPAQDTPASEESWTVHPEHLILVAPSSCDYLGDMAKTGRFQIINNSVRILKFELYWPAHCLTVTPQHGFITPQSKIQILVSPNSSLSTKQSLFPWTGLIYVHCDNGQKKMVRVQIREDLTQEPLPHLASSTFGILVPGPEPSISHLTKPITKPPSTKVAIRSKTVIFPPTEPGQASENYLELENCGPTDVKWHLSSFAPPYVKGVDETGDVFRATYTAFRCSPISGILEGHGIQKVSIMFLPRDRGDYAQFWDVECHPANEPHMKHTLRFQLSGQSIRAENDPEGSCSSSDTLIKVDAAVVSRRHAVSESSTHIPGQLDLSHRGVYAPKDVYMFLPTKLGESRTLKVNLRNNSFFAHALKFLSPRAPFYIKHSKYSLRARHYIHIPVHFRPESVGRFEALLVIQTDEGKSIAVRLIGEALGKS